jgi:hypothetical protein
VPAEYSSGTPDEESVHLRAEIDGLEKTLLTLRKRLDAVKGSEKE